MVAIQVRDVPTAVRDDLARAAKLRGESLQTYLLDVLTREARTARNRETLQAWRPIRTTLDADPADVLEQLAESRRGRDRQLTPRRGEADRRPGGAAS